MAGSPAGPPRIPGPARVPLAGTLAQLRFFADPIGTMTRLRRRHGDVVALAGDTVFAFGPDNNRRVLDDSGLFHNLDASHIPLRVPPGSALERLFTGLIQMNGGQHARQRRLVAPAFARPMLGRYLDGIVEVTRQHIDAWRPGQRRDLADEMAALTLAVAVRLLLGLDPRRTGEDVQRLFRAWTALVFSLSSLLAPWPWPGLPYRRLLAVSNRLETRLREVIALRRAAGTADDCALSILLAASDDPADDVELVGQTNFLFMAGHATTANALIWLLFLLERHPDLWDAVARECASLDETFTPAALSRLPLLDAVVRESLRLMPPVVWWCRIATAPFALGAHALPTGTKVIQSAYMTHRQPDLYPEPDRFLPQRWAGAASDPYRYCPFSAGPRMCMGAGLAMLEIKAVVAAILRRVRLRVVDGSRVDVRGPMILAPKRGLAVDLAAPDADAPPTRIGGNVHALIALPHGR